MVIKKIISQINRLKLQPFGYYSKIIIAMALSMLMLLTGCQKADQTRQKQNNTQNGGGGGIDGSGGNTTNSTLDEVKKVVNFELGALTDRLNWMYDNLNSDEVMYDYAYSKQGAQSVMRAFFQYNNLEQHNKNSNKITKALSDGNIKIITQEAPCATQKNSTINTHSGRAVGNIENGEICISYEKLKMVSPKVLSEEIFALLIHELSHIVGFNEDQAMRIQNLLLERPEIYRTTYTSTAKTTAPLTCDREALKNEINSVKNSAYWKLQINELIRLTSTPTPNCLDKSQDSREDSLVLFAEYAKLIDRTVKFEKYGLNEMLQSNAIGNIFVELDNPDNVEQYLVSQIDISNKDTFIANIVGVNTSNAFCSPKVLIANLIANMPDILKIKCNDLKEINSTERVKERIKKELKILSEEPLSADEE